MRGQPSTRPRVAVIGAGMAGLACARRLRARGATDITVYDKARGPAGRMATHRAGDHAFDSGVPYFGFESAAGLEVLTEWCAAGVVAPWLGRFVELSRDTESELPARSRYVAVPRMTALARFLARSLVIRERTRIVELVRAAGRWALVAEDGAQHPGFDRVVVAIPGEQAAELLAPHAQGFASQAANVASDRCCALMLAFSEALPLPFDGAVLRDSVLGWLASDSSKPGRPPGNRWVLHATPAWSSRHFDSDPAVIQLAMQRALGERFGWKVPAVEYSRLHRWKYAIPTAPLAAGALHDAEIGLTACGEWCVGRRVEDAWISGRRAADLVLAGLAGW